MARSGQVTVTTAGTAVQGDDEPGLEFFVIADPDNTGTVWVGNDGSGDVTQNNGYPLGTSDNAIALRVSNLNELWFDAENNGDKACWIKYR